MLPAAIALLTTTTASYTHGVFPYTEVEKALLLPPWKVVGPVVSTHFVHRLIRARTVLNRAADDSLPDGHCAVYQLAEEGSGITMYLVDYETESRTACVRACLYRQDLEERHLALKELRLWFQTRMGDDWKLHFEAHTTADRFEWEWGVGMLEG